MNRSKIRELIKESLTGYSDYIEGGKTKGLSHDELVTILTNAAKGIKPGKEKEVKKPLKEEENLEQPVIQPGAQDPVDTITLDIPLFLLLLEYAREKSEDDVDLHELTQTVNKLGKERGILNSNDYNDLIGEDNISENIKLRLKEGVKKALFKKPIKEDKKTKSKDNKDGEELESSVKVEDIPQEEPTAPVNSVEGEDKVENPIPPENNKVTMANQGDGKVNPQIKAIQDALTQAQVAAQSLGDEKLLNQVGNTITFFTREYIVGANKPQV